MNKHQELAIEALEEMVENNRYHSTIRWYVEKSPEELQKRTGGPGTVTGADMIAICEKHIADVKAAIEWVKEQDYSQGG